MSYPAADSTSRIAAFLALCSTLVGCGGDSPDKPPVAASLSLAAVEDTPASGQLSASDPRGKPLVFSLATPAGKGNVQIDPNTGAFTYVPAKDLNGLDSFTFVATNPRGSRSAPGVVTVDIAPVNDPPVFGQINTLTNSAESEVVKYKLPLTDVDGDDLTVSVTVGNPAVANAAFDASTGELLVTQLDYGETVVTVTASDGEYSVTAEVPYSVGDVVKSRSIPSDAKSPRRVVVTNNSEVSIDFILRHNGERLETSIESLLESIDQMAAEVPDEPFERKLWRYLRDHVYHELPISTQKFVHDPLTLVNSIGWGLCDDVATAFMHLARASGRESRVWYLEGHVVPEVHADGAWRMYDPDLFVYYHNENLQIASVEDLARSPSLISAPELPLFQNTAGLTAYSTYLAGIYATTENNTLADELVPELVAPVPAIGARFDLPPGGSITYPGMWAPAPMGYDGFSTQPVAATANIRLDLPAGWTGTIRLPLLLAAVYGKGHILVDGVAVEGNSYEIVESYQARRVAPQEIEIRESESVISIVMLINPLRFLMRDMNDLNVTGRDVWGLDLVGIEIDDTEAIDAAAVDSLRKPAP